jgi:serine/threonine protein kinase
LTHAAAFPVPTDHRPHCTRRAFRLPADIKPANFVFDGDGVDKKLKLIDFGLAQSIEAGPGGEAGSPKYVAPEVLAPYELSAYDERVDVWSLGVMSYAMLTGKLPFDGESRSEIFASIVEAEYDREALLGSCSTEAAEFVQLLLAKNPGDRIPLSEALDHPFLRTTARGQGGSEVLLAGVAGASGYARATLTLTAPQTQTPAAPPSASPRPPWPPPPSTSSFLEPSAPPPLGIAGNNNTAGGSSSNTIADLGSTGKQLINTSPAFSPMSIGAAKWTQQQPAVSRGGSQLSLLKTQHDAAGSKSSPGKFSDFEVAVAGGRLSRRSGSRGGGSLLLRTSASQAVQGELGLRQRVVRAVQRGYRRFVQESKAALP